MCYDEGGKEMLPVKPHRLFAAAFAVLLTAYTGFVLLDTFVLPQTYRENAAGANLSLFSDNAETALSSAAQQTETQSRTAAGETVSESAAQSDPLPQSSENTYSDGNMTVTLTEHRVNGTAVYAADVQLSSAQSLRTAFAQDQFGRNITEKTSTIAAAHNAVLAINGDYCGAQERGIVIRNGVLYRETAGSSDVCCIYADGSMKTYAAGERTAADLTEEGVWQAFSFGPGLLADGQITVSAHDEVGRAMASNPRTAIGMISPLHYVFVVSDGRTAESEGLSLCELAEFMQTLGVQNAYNLDGGGSSAMVFQGRLINKPTTTGTRIRERSVSDIVYIG